YPPAGIDSQSIYGYFANNRLDKISPRTDGMCFTAQNGELQRPYRTFNRSLEEHPQYPYFRIMDHANSLLTAWHSKTDKEPTEFELLDLSDMSHDNVAWLRASGESNSIIVNKTEKLLAMVYHDEGWRVDIRRSDNFQLREVVHHAAPIVGVFFHNDVVFSLSDKLIVSYPEERHESRLISSSKKILGWARHPTDPYLVLIEPERYRIIDLNTLALVKTAEWTEQLKWFNIMQKYSNHSLELYVDKSTAEFSTDGNRLFLGGYGQLAVFDWHDMLRPRCVQPEPANMINMHSANYSKGDQGKSIDAHVIDMIPVNRDKLLCVTADGYLSMVNIRTGEIFLLLKPGSGVRMNSLQLCANGKYLAMLGYYYNYDDSGCEVESALLIWKLSRLLRKGSKI
ncbi:MAG: hypothetical protein KAS17_00025, partial [Victivallaceae bacterium]|nr:hypothetical protein [Victivallaceae bacterium]